MLSLVRVVNLWTSCIEYYTGQAQRSFGYTTATILRLFLSSTKFTSGVFAMRELFLIEIENEFHWQFCELTGVIATAVAHDRGSYQIIWSKRQLFLFAFEHTSVWGLTQNDTHPTPTSHQTVPFHIVASMAWNGALFGRSLLKFSLLFPGP